MKENIYFDTSALAKWYLNEPRSEEVEEYIQAHGPVGISDLTVVEMRSLLSRRRREKSIDLSLEMRIFAVFQEYSVPSGSFTMRLRYRKGRE